jgi:glycosyltransferase involved in cell wall biosynthesis
MNIVIVTDAWEPQVNGVVRTLQSVRRELERKGDHVTVIAPDRFPSVPCPTYPEIKLAMAGAGMVGRAIEAAAPDALHISTEGPLGLAARRWCLRRGLPFTTAYHTQFPEYIEARTGVPVAWTWRWMRWFHAPSAAVLVSTATVRRSLQAHGISHTRHWGRGVDLDRFRPDVVATAFLFDGLARPIQLYVGRVAVEKNIEAFLETRQPGTRVIVGDGPARAALSRRYPDAVFLGALAGDALAGAYAGADVFVFPSRTDTFGLVMIEALASGTPVAAYPVAGPIDVLEPDASCLDENLDRAIAGALDRDRGTCAQYGRRFSWEASARQFRDALVTFDRVRRAA